MSWSTSLQAEKVLAKYKKETGMSKTALIELAVTFLPEIFRRLGAEKNAEVILYDKCTAGWY